MNPILPTYQVFVPVKMAQSAITASVVTIYTTPANTRALTQDILVCNTTGSAITCNVFIVPAGGTAGTANAILYGYSIAKNDTYHYSGQQVLFPGDTIQVQGSTTGLTISISGQQAS